MTNILPFKRITSDDLREAEIENIARDLDKQLSVDDVIARHFESQILEEEDDD